MLESRVISQTLDKLTFQHEITFYFYKICFYFLINTCQPLSFQVYKIIVFYHKNRTKMSKYRDLEIHIPQDESEDSFSHVTLSRLRTLNSMKNLHDLRKVENQEMPGNLVMNLKIKLMNMKKLEKEKKQLIEQYQSLKKGAICAIMEKEDMICSLKEKCDNYQLYGGDQQLQELQVELQKHLKYILELQQEREELRQKIQNERLLYMDDIQNKSHMISALWKQLQVVQEQLEKMESKEASVELRLRMTEEQNQKLARSLSQTKENYFLLKSSQSQKSVVKQTKQIQARLSEVSIEKQSQGQVSEDQRIQEHESDEYNYNRLILKNKSLLSPTSSASTKPNAFDRIFRKKSNDADSQSFFTEKLLEQKRRHRHQIENLNRYYAQQLQTLRQQVQKTYLDFQNQNEKDDQIKMRNQQPSRITQMNNQYDSDEEFIEKNLRVQQQENSQPKILHKVIKNCDSAENLKVELNDLQIEPPSHYSPNYSPLQTDRTNKTYGSAKSNTSQKQIKQDQQCSQRTWTKKVCFVLGVITGGSLVALVSRIIYANN